MITNDNLPGGGQPSGEEPSDTQGNVDDAQIRKVAGIPERGAPSKSGPTNKPGMKEKTRPPKR
jgi:hypothetical protein